MDCIFFLIHYLICYIHYLLLLLLIKKIADYINNVIAYFLSYHFLTLTWKRDHRVYQSVNHKVNKFYYFSIILCNSLIIGLIPTNIYSFLISLIKVADR